MNTTELIALAKECNAGENQFGLYIFKIDELAKFAELLAKRNAANIDALMEQAQVFASSYSLVGSPFASDDQFAESEHEKAELRRMISASLPAEQDAERYRMARTLGIAVVNDKGNITGAHFNEGADMRVDTAIANRKDGV
jgi:alpha-D-ribose 1-methylphosphonate 5-triphosphate synthase subunit PhnG